MIFCIILLFRILYIMMDGNAPTNAYDIHRYTIHTYEHVCMYDISSVHVLPPPPPVVRGWWVIVNTVDTRTVECPRK